ncbi:unnamed protein product [Linum trigynum]|uniref:DUF4283 domain-containing protein n=1 Tax=Linum trigynum TaxID=586398 RepID=A0AAV2EE78_9ROSI
MVVWIQLPAFPVHFYHKEILFTLGNMVGRQGCQTANTPVAGTGTLTRSPEKWSETLSEDKTGFGPWIKVTRRSRRGPRAPEKGNNSAIQGDLAGFGKAGKGKTSYRDMEGSNGQKETPSQREEMARGGTHIKGKTASVGHRNGIVGVGREATEEIAAWTGAEKSGQSEEALVTMVGDSAPIKACVSAAPSSAI